MDRRMNTFDGPDGISRIEELKAAIPRGHVIVMMLRANDGVRVFTSAKPHDVSWQNEVLIPHRPDTFQRTSKSDPIPPGSSLAA